MEEGFEVFYNTQELYDRLYKFMPINEDRKDFQEFIEKYIFSRLRIFDEFQCVIFEEEYVETAWKDMISLHYINTSYKFRTKVARIHYFYDKVDLKKSYLGYITLRPIEEYTMMLSFVMPNFDNIKYFKKASFVMWYQEDVHIGSEKYTIKTFPYFRQDSSVASCANADILMVTLFLNKLFGYKKIQLFEMQKKILTSAFPTDGLDVHEILELFHENKIPVRANTLLTESDDSATIIKTYVESFIPVILGIDEHVVTIIGLTYKGREGDCDFIVYDDSGYLTTNAGLSSSFIETISWDKIKEIISESTDEKDAENYVIIPAPERIYIHYPEIKKFVIDYLGATSFFSELCVKEENITNELRQAVKNRWPEYKDLSINAINKKIVEIIKNDGDKFLYDLHIVETIPRHLIIESWKLKELLDKNEKYMIGDTSVIYKEFLSTCGTHYIWYSAYYLKDSIIIVCSDPTRNKTTCKMFSYAFVYSIEADFKELKLLRIIGKGRENV